jgi:hypothetical protein
MTRKELVEQELKIVRMLFEKTKSLDPLFILIHEDHRAVLPVGFANDDHKDILSTAIKELVKKTQPDAVIYMAEAWMIKVSQEEMSKHELPRPSIRKDRIECINVQIEFKTGERFGCTANITRHGHQVELGEFNIADGLMMSGRFTDFYPPTRLQ